jgi:hypothetical protein
VQPFVLPQEVLGGEGLLADVALPALGVVLHRLQLLLQGLGRPRGKQGRKQLQREGNRVTRDTVYRNGGKIYQITPKLPNGHNIYQMAITYTKWPKCILNGKKCTNIFHLKALQNLHKLGFWVSECVYHLATLEGNLVLSTLYC